MRGKYMASVIKKNQQEDPTRIQGRTTLKPHPYYLYEDHSYDALRVRNFTEQIKIV